MEHHSVARNKEGKVGDGNHRSSRPARAVPLTAHPLHQLQRSLGNRAVARLFQAKLKVSQPGDEYEQEADRVADQVTRMSDPGRLEGHRPIEPSKAPADVQRACSKCEEDNEEKTVQRRDADEAALDDSPPAPANLRIQAKPEVNEQEDPAEQEAKNTADAEAIPESISLVEVADAEEMTPATSPKEDLSSPETIDRKAADGNLAENTPNLQASLDSRLGQGAALPAETLARMETAIGASFREVRVHTDNHAADLNRSLHAQAFTYGRDIFFGEGRFDPSATAGHHLLAHELTHVVQQRGLPGTVINRQKVEKPKSVSATFTVTVHEEVSGHEFFVRAVMQYRKIARAEAEQLVNDGKFRCSGKVCSGGVTADLVGKPVGVTVDIGGISKGEKKAIAHRTAQISALPPAERKDVNDEVDRRFWSRTEHKRGQPLGKGPQEEGMRNLWLRTREEVMQDQENIAKLPPEIREFLNPGAKRKIRPEDYAILLRLARKLQNFSQSDWLLYKRRVTASTDNYELLERSIENFQTQRAGEQQTIARISGQEGLYQHVKRFKKLRVDMLTPPLKSDRLPLDLPGNAEIYEAEKVSINAALAAAKFASIEEFDAACADFVKVFRKRAVEITLLALHESEKAVFAERKRYEQSTENERLFNELAPMRVAVEESHEAFRAAMPTPMQLKTETTEQTAGQEEAQARYIKSSQKADAEREKHESTNPILKDAELRNAALNVKDATALGEVLRNNADARLSDIRKTRVNVLESGDLIFKLNRISEMTRQELNVTPNSIYDLAVNDYKENVAFTETLIAIATGALAIGLGLISFGGGTYAVLAAGGGFLLSGYQAGEEWEKYSVAQSAAHTSFDKALSVSSEEPSLVWVAVALIGVGFDGVALVSAFKAAAPAARVLSQSGGSVAKFESELAKVTELSGAVKNSLSRAARAEEEFQVAVKELGQAMMDALGRTHHLGLDPDVFAKVTKAAYHAVKKGITTFEVFLRELKLQKFAKSIDFNSLGPKDIEALEKAFRAGADQLAADAAKTTFSVKIPYKAGDRLLTLDASGKFLVDGKPLAASKYQEVYKELGLTHAYKGHGPGKNLADVAQEALTNKPSFASGKFSSDKDFIESFEAARAKFIAQGGTEPVVYIEATPSMGRAFLRNDKVPSGITPMLPFDAPPGVSEVVVTRVRAIFAPDGSLTSIYPIGF